MANHYLENGFALLFAACYFNDKAFFRKADRILRSQLKEQILPDGAHYELSPMYHCIILERLLDCYSVIDHQQHNTLALFMLGKIKSMLGWLETIVMSDGNIPLLNDSALGIAPMPSELFSYARSLGVEWSPSVLADCGYRKFKGHSYDVLVDVAAMGPSYNLGHSHADTFTFVMNVDGKPFIVDTGISTYGAGKRRSYERSTIAHNTVAVNGADSSRVWGAFRCAERAKVTVVKDGDNFVCAQHNGYESMSVLLKRTFVCKGAEFKIIDEVCCSDKDVDCVSMLFLSPDVNVVSFDYNTIRTSSGIIQLDGAVSVEVEPVEIAVSYNILRSTKRIAIAFKEKLSIVFVINQVR